MKQMFEKRFFTGINYWGSKDAINMWENFDRESVENDIRLLSEVGVTHLRVFPLWPVFQPLYGIYGFRGVYEYTFKDGEELPSTEAGRAGVSEEACLKFEEFLEICGKYNMKLIVAVITGHMSFRTYNPPAFDGKMLLTDPTVIKWQLRFVKYFVSRFKNSSSIVAWDLGNEVENLPSDATNPDAFYVWCDTIGNAIRLSDGTRPVISGLARTEFGNMPVSFRMIEDTCDLHTVHPYNIFQSSADPLVSQRPILDLSYRCKIAEDLAKTPTFVQEFGAIGYTNCSKKTEADFYRASLYTSLAHGCHGVMWWCAFDQGMHNYPPYRWNAIGSDYGFFDKDLGKKPVAEENVKFKKNLESIENGVLPPHRCDGVILVPRCERTSDELNEVIRASYILAKRANLDVSFADVLDEIPDAPFYIFPSLKYNKTITKSKLDVLLEKVKNGAVLYLSLDTALLRGLPDFTGVSIAYREDVSEVRHVDFGDGTLPIFTNKLLTVESAEAEVIATDKDAGGVFFKYKYGDGLVYLLTMPLEAYLATRRGAFFKENEPNYDRIYREIAKAADTKRLIDSDSPFVRLTEHPVSEDECYAMAINYSNKAQAVRLTLKDGYGVSTVFGSTVKDGTLEIGANDATLLKLVKA